MNLRTEQLYPYVIASLVAVGCYYGKVQFPKGQDVLSASITIGAIFTGFLATSKSLAISIETPAMEELRKTKFFDLMIQYLREAIYISLLLSIIGILGFFYDSENPPIWYGVVWSFFLTATFLTFFRVTNSLLLLIKTRKKN